MRGVTKSAVSTPQQLKKELLKQFGADLISCDLKFSVGYMKGNSKVSIVSSADMNDLWTTVSTKGDDGVVLWCDKNY